MTAQTKKNIAYTLSTFAVEGLKPSKDAVSIYRHLDEGKISLPDAIRAIEQKHGVKAAKRV